MDYKEKTFNLPAMPGISDESVKQHLGLYSGYVKNFNAISKALTEYAQDPEKNALALAELMRRRSFEFGGMRLHEYYFPQLEGGPKALDEDSALGRQLLKDYHKLEYFLPYFKMVAGLRGPGWAILYWDQEATQFIAGWTEEQHLGTHPLPIVLALDVWEHAYVLDYGASGRSKYIDAFFNNLNWSVVEERFTKLSNS